MKKTQIIEEYWEAFLQDCHYSLVTHGADANTERAKAEPTDNNFWAWYMKNRMVQQNARIDEHIRNSKVPN